MVFRQCLDFTAFICIIGEHFIYLLQVIAGNTIRDDVDIVSGLCHVEACGFHASCGVCSSDIKLIYIFPLDAVSSRIFVPA